MTDYSTEETADSIIKGDLLPPNATELERKLSRFAASISEIAVDTGRLWDAECCTEAFLPWLAWAMSVDYWQSDWHENVKRSLVKQSITLHQQRGTRASVRHAVRLVLALADNPNRDDISNLAAYDNSFLIREWWERRSEDVTDIQTGSPQKSQRRQPLTFEIQLLIGRGVLGGRGLLRPELYRDLRRALDVVTPMSVRYTLSIGGAKLETELPMRSMIRTVRTVSFTVIPKVALKLESRLPSASVVRAVESRFIKLSAKSKLK